MKPATKRFLWDVPWVVAGAWVITAVNYSAGGPSWLAALVCVLWAAFIARNSAKEPGK